MRKGSDTRARCRLIRTSDPVRSGWRAPNCPAGLVVPGLRERKCAERVDGPRLRSPSEGGYNLPGRFTAAGGLQVEVHSGSIACGRLSAAKAAATLADARFQRERSVCRRTARATHLHAGRSSQRDRGAGRLWLQQCRQHKRGSRRIGVRQAGTRYDAHRASLARLPSCSRCIATRRATEG